MAGRKIRKERFALLDDLGFGTLCKLYVESSTSVPDLCQFLFDLSPGHPLVQKTGTGSVAGEAPPGGGLPWRRRPR